MGPEISVVVPMRNEAPNVEKLYRDVTASLSAFGRPYEIVAIDDGSRDETFQLLARLQATDPRLRVIRFRRNFGQTAAFAAGFKYARGRYIVTADGDNQNDPADIPAMIEMLEQHDLDIVCGWRKDRKDPFINRRLPSMIANAMISKATGVNLHDYGCSLKVFRAEVVKQMKLYGEMHRFLPAIAAEYGVAIGETVVNHRAREHGKVSVGSFFVSGGFYVAENPALGRPWLAWMQVWEGLIRLAGPTIPWLAVVAFAAVVASAFRPKVHGAEETRTSDSTILVLALAASAALPLYAYFKGHPVRVRYDVPLVAACAAIIGAGVSLLPRKLQPIAGIVVVALASWQVHPFDQTAPVVVESQREAANMEGRRAVTAYLTAHWDGQPILMSMGSLAHYMHDLSRAQFAIRDFIHEGNGEIWKYAVAHPQPVAEWIAIEERAEGGDALNWQATHDANFLRGYARVAEGGGVALYRRR